MTTAMRVLILATMAALAAAAPSYIAVPADQIAFLDLRGLSVRRVPRQVLTPPPPPIHLPYNHNQDLPPLLQSYQRQPVAAPQPAPARIQVQDTSGAALEATSQFAERAPDFGEYVDFGAHTGDHGAFGWYADYPINNHQDTGY